MRRMVPVYNGWVRMENYELRARILVEDAYFGEYGELESPTTLPLNEFEVSVVFAKGTLMEHPAADHLSKVFDNRGEANFAWSIVRHTNPTLGDLLKAGFTPN